MRCVKIRTETGLKETAGNLKELKRLGCPKDLEIKG